MAAAMKADPVGPGGASEMRGDRAAPARAHTENLRPTIWLLQKVRCFAGDQQTT